MKTNTTDSLPMRYYSFISQRLKSPHKQYKIHNIAVQATLSIIVLQWLLVVYDCMTDMNPSVPELSQIYVNCVNYYPIRWEKLPCATNLANNTTDRFLSGQNSIFWGIIPIWPFYHHLHQILFLSFVLFVLHPSALHSSVAGGRMISIISLIWQTIFHTMVGVLWWYFFKWWYRIISRRQDKNWQALDYDKMRQRDAQLLCT